MLATDAKHSHSQINSEWQAELTVEIERHQHRSFLKYWNHKGPLKLQRAFYPEGKSVCHLTVLHPPGGIVAGDNLSLNFNLATNAHSVITTPSAGKFYHTNSNNQLQTQNTHARLSAGAILEWLPQENIIFNGANAKLNNHFILEQNAQLIGWDINCLGRPASQELFLKGCFNQRLQLWRVQTEKNKPITKPIYIENSLYQGGHKLLNSKCGLQDYPVFGTFFATGKTQQLDDIRKSLQHKTCITSASQLPELIVCRYLGTSTEQAKTLFTTVWNLVRQELLHRPACRPRIWDT